MSLQLPGSLTPSKVSSFKDCALAFRFSVIDKLPEPPSLQAFKGTLVHRALELLIWEEEPGARTPAVAFAKLDRALAELLQDDEGQALGLDQPAIDELADDARTLVRNYFELEDPNKVRAIGTELRLQADLGGEGNHLRLRGVIDRLELDADGGLVVTDYKTGRAPGHSQEQARLGGVHFYAFLCEQVLGRRPVRVQLFHLREPLAIYTAPSDQSITGLERQATAIWAAVKKACVTEDFRPKPGTLCQWCGYHAYCPAQGGDPALAALAVLGASPRPPKVGAGTEAGVAGAATLFPVAIG